MKKKAMIIGLCALCLGALACTATACAGGQTVEGEYSYQISFDGGTTQDTYGQRVRVTVGTDGKISAIVPLEWANVKDITPANDDYGWSAENVANWRNNRDNMLKSYVGKTAREVLAIPVTKETDGKVPQTVGDSALVVTGATQSSGRLLLAVQDALKKLN